MRPGLSSRIAAAALGVSLLIAVWAVLGVGGPVLGQTSSFTVTTSRIAYAPGDTLVVTLELTTTYGWSGNIDFEILDSSGSVRLAQPVPRLSTREPVVLQHAIPDRWPSGQYLVRACATLREPPPPDTTTTYPINYYPPPPSPVVLDTYDECNTTTFLLNRAPVASPIALTAFPNEAVVFDVRNHASDADGSVVSWSSQGLPDVGTVSNSGGTRGTYRGGRAPCGTTTSWSYFVFDDSGARSTPARITATIDGCPRALPSTVEAVAGQPSPIEVSGTDPDGRVVSWQIVSGPSLGDLEVGSGLEGSIVAPSEACGQETSFTFRVVDDLGGVSGVATTTVQFEDCLVLTDDEGPDGDGGFASIDVLANDEIPGGVDAASVRIVEPPANGEAEFVQGVLEYQADDGFMGTDRLVYEACDLQAQCGDAEVLIEVQWDCLFDDAAVTVEPPSAKAGDEVAVTVVVDGEGIDKRCTVLSVELTFDGIDWGELELVRVGATGAAAPGGLLAAQVVPVDAFVGERTLVVPGDVEPGDHKIGATDSANGAPVGEALLAVADAVIGVATPTTVAAVVGEPVATSPVVPVAVLVGLAAAAGGGVWLAGRRRGDQTVDPCPGERELVQVSDRTQAAADAQVAQSEARLSSLEAELAALEGELSQCVQGRSRAAGVLPLGGTTRGSELVISEYLLDGVENPNVPAIGGAPRWWWTDRSQPVDRIVVCDVTQLDLDPSTADDGLVKGIGEMPTPFAAHLLASPSGITGLLPDTVSVPIWPGALVVVVSDPGDADALQAAGRAVSAWSRSHGLAAADVVAGVVAGSTTTVDVGSLPSAPVVGSRAIGAVPTAGVAGVDDCAAIRTRRDAKKAQVDSATAELERARADADRARTEAEEASDSLRECECRPMPVTGVPEEAAQEDDGNESRWFLLKHQNPNAPLRVNEKRGWYHPARNQPVSGIVVHTAEAASGPGTAHYLSTVSRPASAHVIADATGIIKLLPDSYTAFHAAGGNARGLGIEIEYFADVWGSDPVLEEALLRNAAIWCGMKAAAYGVPPVRLTAEEWAAGKRGFVAHGDLDPSRRRDPGHAFPWDDFLERVSQFTGGGNSPS